MFLSWRTEMKFNALIPELSVTDIQNSLHFYTNILNFKIEYERKEDKFAFLQMENVQLMIQEINFENNKWQVDTLKYPLGNGINFQIDVTNIDEIYNRLRENKYDIFVQMEEHWYRKDNVLMGCREFLVQDPNGYVLRFSQDLEDKEINK
jgi:catechol 2,3-dioxygenase-like lactoylglutathione lyase family enzyme